VLLFGRDGSHALEALRVQPSKQLDLAQRLRGARHEPQYRPDARLPRNTRHKYPSGVPRRDAVKSLPQVSTPYRGRFAPSPTGPLHLGLARTALLGWLRARAEGGRFVLRIEDLDTPRVVPGASAALLADLRWLGLDWDEGPDVGGPHAPYVQSQRLADYAAAIASLREAGHVYRCTCSRKEVNQASAPHGPSEFGAPYPGTCRAGESKPGAAAALRFRVPEPLPGFVDGLSGRTLEPLAQGDFVVQRADGLYSYQLAVVVDDLAMNISEVLRGDDLAGCTAGSSRCSTHSAPAVRSSCTCRCCSGRTESGWPNGAARSPSRAIAKRAARTRSWSAFWPPRRASSHTARA